MYGVLFSDGHLNLEAIRPECVKDGWVPLCTHGSKIVLFLREKTGYNFVSRNIPKNWPQGLVMLTEDVLKWIEEKGLQTEIWAFPRRVPLTELGFEIVELGEVPDMKVNGVPVCSSEF